MVKVDVILTPRASKDELLGLRDGALRARVKAPPVDGRANAALCRLVAKRIGVPAGRVRVVRGHKGRRKLLEIEGAGPAALRSLGL